MRFERVRALPTTAKVVIASAAILAVALLFAQDQETLRVDSPLAVDDPLFPRYVAALTGSALTTGDEYKILVNGDQIFPAMLEAIRAAQRRISFETYIFDRGQVAETFTTALADAASRGV